MEPMRPEDPREIGGYQLEARLGSGGFGTVYLGRSPGGRRVAVKCIHDQVAAGDPQFRRRFAEEIEAARRVGGFHTAQVIDAGPDHQPPYLVTAYIPGPTLLQVVDELGALPEPTLRILGAGLAEALQAVHAVGLVHRDLKPSNVLIANDGSRVIDFGIARALDRTAFTGSRTIVGTPAFMSPEQARGLPLTPASDVFNLGLVLCFAGAGRPFGEGPTDALLYRIVHEEPDLSAVPTSLQAAVAACLAKDPTRRPSSAELLQVFGNETPIAEWLPQPVRTLVAGRAATPPTPGPRPGSAMPSGTVPVRPPVTVSQTPKTGIPTMPDIPGPRPGYPPPWPPEQIGPYAPLGRPGSRRSGVIAAILVPIVIISVAAAVFVVARRSAGGTGSGGSSSSGGTAVVTGGASAGPGPLHISLDKAEVHVGDRVLLSGAGFAPGETVFVHLNWGHVEDKGVIATIQANADGSFSDVPVRLTFDGGYVVTALGQTSRKETETTIQIDP